MRVFMAHGSTEHDETFSFKADTIYNFNKEFTYQTGY